MLLKYFHFVHQVGSDDKRKLLQQRFPQLCADNFANSHNAHEFELHIRERTKGRGVDLVLNSLAEDKLQVRAYTALQFLLSEFYSHLFRPASGVSLKTGDFVKLANSICRSTIV
jgi:hypothetical protein